MRYFKTPQNTVHAIDEGQEFLIQDDWAEMTAAEVEAHINPPPTNEQKRQQLQRDRDTALQQMVHWVEGVGPVQVRPQDYLNFTSRIAAGQDREWVLADNTTAMMTVDQMQECLDSGMAQGSQIWDDYIVSLKELNES